jgi:hypothetical protein
MVPGAEQVSGSASHAGLSHTIDAHNRGSSVIFQTNLQETLAESSHNREVRPCQPLLKKIDSQTTHHFLH